MTTRNEREATQAPHRRRDFPIPTALERTKLPTTNGLYEKGSIRFGETLQGGGKVMYPVRDPTTSEKPPKVASTGNLLGPWYIADRLVSTGNLPIDPVPRTAAIIWLNDISTRWKAALKVLRTDYREQAVLGFSEHGIIIEKKIKSLREEELASAPRPADPIPADQLRVHLSAIAKSQRPSLGEPNDQTLANFWKLAQQDFPGCTVGQLGEAIRRVVKDNAGLKGWGGIFDKFRKDCDAKTKAAGGES